MSSQNVVTSRRFNGWWCPDVCPITLLKFFMWIEHPDFGWVPTYGGPFDSYTIPEPSDVDAKNRFDVEYERYRFDHDEGWWVDGVEVVPERVVQEETLLDAESAVVKALEAVVKFDDNPTLEPGLPAELKEQVLSALKAY